MSYTRTRIAPRTRPGTASALTPSAPASGQSLDRKTERTMGARFGHDFSRVRIFTDSEAAESAAALGASAYTIGENIVFGPGQYGDNSPDAQRLLAHELTHVVQQAQAGPGDPARSSDRADASEREAETASRRVLAGKRVRVQAAPDAAVARQGGPGQPDQNAVLEQAAHVLTYEEFGPDGQRINRYDPVRERDQYEAEEQKHAFAVAMLQRAGYDVESQVQQGGRTVEQASSPTVTGRDDFAMRSFMPRRGEDGNFLPGVAPIVSFRGTVPDLEHAGTIVDDLNPDGIGAGQFRGNRDLIAQQMQQAAQAGPVNLTGHSLGGALAQRAAAAFPEQVGGVTTFQSARVGHDVARQFDANNAARAAQGLDPIVSHHIRTAADVVPWGGQDLTRGDVSTYGMSRNGEELGRASLGEAHSALPATGYAGQNGGIPGDLTGPGGGAVVNPYAPGGNNPRFGDPRVITTDQDKADDWGVIERARRVLGLPVNMAYHGGGWAMERGGQAVSGIAGAASDTASWGLGKVGQMGSGLYNAGTDAAGWGLNRLGEAGSGLLHAGESAGSWGLGKLGEAGSGLLHAGTDATRWGLARGDEAVSGVTGAARDATGWAGGKLGQAASGIGGFLNNARQWNSPGDVVSGVGGGLRDALGWTAGAAGEAARGVGGSIGQATGWLGSTARGALSGVGGALGSVMNWAGDTAGQAAGGIRGALGGAAGWLGNTAHDAVSGVGGAANNALGWLGNTAGEAGRGISSAASQAASWAGNVGSDVVSGAGQAGRWIYNTLF